MSKKSAKRQPITQDELDMYRPLESEGEIAQDFMCTPESQAAAVEFAITVFAETARWNAALGMPINEDVDFIRRALPYIKAGAGTSEGGKKGAATRADQLKGTNTMKARIIAATVDYKGDKRKRASFIAGKLRISSTNAVSYVRTVLREAGL